MPSRSVIYLLFATLKSAVGFYPIQCIRTNSALSSLQSYSEKRSMPISEDQYMQFLSSASKCADSDSCSVDMAKAYLREIVHIESACAAGTMSGDAVCNDVFWVSEVVAALREKCRSAAKCKVKTFWEQRQDELEKLVLHSLDETGTMSSVTTLTHAPIKPTYLAFAAFYAIFLITQYQPADLNQEFLSDTSPFTTQEILWAISDGYVGDLTRHWLRNGGL